MFVLICLFLPFFFFEAIICYISFFLVLISKNKSFYLNILKIGKLNYFSLQDIVQCMVNLF